MVLHILQTPSIARPWWRTDERFDETAGAKVWTDCCACKVPAEDTVSRVVDSCDIPHGGFGCFQEQPPLGGTSCRCEEEPPTGAWYGPRIETRCAEGCGCNINPKKRRGKHLREMWRFG